MFTFSTIILPNIKLLTIDVNQSKSDFVFIVTGLLPYNHIILLKQSTIQVPNSIFTNLATYMKKLNPSSKLQNTTSKTQNNNTI